MPRFIFLVLPKRYIIAICVLFLAVAFIYLPTTYSYTTLVTAVTSPDIKYDIVLDAGHGGIDSGGLGSDIIVEKNITLDIVLQMKDILEKAGLTVGLTRADDYDATYLTDETGSRHRRDLLGRYKFMHSGNIGMSVHVNAAKSVQEEGAIVFYMRDSYIGQRYAQIVLEEIEQIQVLNHDFVVPRNNLFLLQAKTPVVMVEVGFLTNPSDFQKLSDPEYLTKFAESLSKAILKFKKLFRLEQTE